MSWYWFILGAALAGAIGQLTRKKALFHEHAIALNGFRGYVTLVLLLFIAPFIPLTISSQDALFLLALSTLMSWGIVLANRAVRHSDISEISPLSGLGTIGVLFLGMLFLGEFPDTQSLIGIFVCVFGVYLLKYRRHDVLGPFRQLINRYPKMYIFALFLFALSTVGLREVVGRISPLTTMFYLFLFISIQSIIAEYVFFGTRDIKEFKKEALPIILSSAFFLAGDFLLVIGLSFPQAKVAMAHALAGAGMLVVTFVGGRIFHEKNLLRKSGAAVIIILGSLLIIL